MTDSPFPTAPTTPDAPIRPDLDAFLTAILAPAQEAFATAGDQATQIVAAAAEQSYHQGVMDTLAWISGRLATNEFRQFNSTSGPATPIADVLRLPEPNRV